MEGRTSCTCISRAFYGRDAIRDGAVLVKPFTPYALAQRIREMLADET